MLCASDKVFKNIYTVLLIEANALPEKSEKIRRKKMCQFAFRINLHKFCFQQKIWI